MDRTPPHSTAFNRMAFTALYSDGYKRTIAGPVNTLAKANKYAKDLEIWFNNPDRLLVKVEPKL